MDVLSHTPILPRAGDTVCFCFGYTRGDIEKDWAEAGRSTILERIVMEKRAGACRCGTTNPKGG